MLMKDDRIMQHKIFLDVLYEYESSHWPWVRLVAEHMHREIMRRCAETAHKTALEMFVRTTNRTDT
jgi:hypothetical protein